MGEEADLSVPRPDGAAALAYYNGLRAKWAKLERQYPTTGARGVPDDLEKYGKIKEQKAELEIAMNYLTWFNTAKVGYIYAKTTPRNAGNLFLRCSDPRGKRHGQIPLEVAHTRLECTCGWGFI